MDGDKALNSGKKDGETQGRALFKPVIISIYFESFGMTLF
jgi:hypothetical protein